MKAVYYNKFEGPVEIRELPDPELPDDGVIIKVEASGICRSDWHGWMGHEKDIQLPHVPGHELAGTIAEVGKGVRYFKKGDRVTLPFVCGCGVCPECTSGNHQVCDFQFQPGFTHWGSFAEYVAIHYADTNLVRLPLNMDFETAASLGCRFVTSFRAIVTQGNVSAGEWVAIHGCGGVGLSAIMIASALGANVIAIDIDDEKLAFTKTIGATKTINARKVENVVEKVKNLTRGGVHVSIDALGNKETSWNSIANLRKRGRHVQIGLMVGDHAKPQIPMDLVIASELEIKGSHGMQAHKYGPLLHMIASGKLQPEKLIGRRIALEEAPKVLMEMGNFHTTGITVINKF